MPIWKLAPDAAVQIGTTGPSTRSIAVALNSACAPDADVAIRSIRPGSESAGAVVSRTRTVNPVDVTLPARSRAAHCTGLSPSGKTVPDAGLHDTATLPSTASLAIGDW